jgi:cbb3-type cytochrome oxidase maturation protein
VEILFLMVPLGMVLVGLGLWAFFCAVGSGQFDDLDTPGWTVLDDDEPRTTSADPRPEMSDAPREPPAT